MKKITNTVVFKYEEQDKNLINELGTYIDEKLPAIYEFFKINMKNEKVIINIIAKKDELDTIHRRFNDLEENVEVPKWLIGFSASDMQIYYLSLNAYKSTTHVFSLSEYYEKLIEYKKTILHECIHYVNRLFCKENNCHFSCRFLAEGIALYLSNQMEGKSLKFDYSIESILNSNSCYNGWYLVTKYILEKYSCEKFLELLKDSKMAELFLKEEFLNIRDYYFNLEKYGREN